MKIVLKLVFSIILLLLLCKCSNQKQDFIEIEKVQPWCILGFDSLNRTPKERIAMLKKLGLSSYGYNKGKGNLQDMEEEFSLAKENNLEITSVFLWLNAKRDSIGKLSPYNQQLLNNLKNAPFKPTLWLSFSDNYFNQLSHKESVNFCVNMILFVKTKADELNCNLALYNHRGWFGNPYNQVEILEKLNTQSIKMVYNFHHAHEYVDEFSVIAKKIKPYLYHVNLSGIKKEGPEILAIGTGDYEYSMIQTLQHENYTGTWGILGHIKTKDVEKVLIENIKGLKKLNRKTKLE